MTTTPPADPLTAALIAAHDAIRLASDALVEAHLAIAAALGAVITADLQAGDDD